jgi:hypothetical protein
VSGIIHGLVLYVWKEGVNMTALCLELDTDLLEDDEKSWDLRNWLRLQSWFHMFLHLYNFVVDILHSIGSSYEC